MVIYKITNTITQDFYVGSAINFANRKVAHINSLKYNRHKNAFLQNSWNKYGRKAFTFEIIETVDIKENLIPREQYWIDTLLPTFNLCKIAGSPLGVKHTDEARRNMSIAHLGKSLEERGHKLGCNCTICNRKTGENSPRYIPREERVCMCGCGGIFTSMITSNKRFISGHNKSNLGRKKTTLEIEKQRNSLKEYFKNGGKSSRLGSKASVETKNVMSKSKLIPIIQCDLNGDFLKEWDGITIAAKNLKISGGNICSCLKQKKKTAGNFIWKYKSNT
jgi:group I intron endonuclease